MQSAASPVFVSIDASLVGWLPHSTSDSTISMVRVKGQFDALNILPFRHRPESGCFWHDFAHTTEQCFVSIAFVVQLCLSCSWVSAFAICANQRWACNSGE